MMVCSAVTGTHPARIRTSEHTKTEFAEPAPPYRQAGAGGWAEYARHSSIQGEAAVPVRTPRQGRPAYRLPSSAAVSDIRLEKPHSLSYHASTRASSPSTTVVCVASNVDEAGLWLKSMLTSGAVL